MHDGGRHAGKMVVAAGQGDCRGVPVAAGEAPGTACGE